MGSKFSSRGHKAVVEETLHATVSELSNPGTAVPSMSDLAIFDSKVNGIKSELSKTSRGIWMHVYLSEV